MTRYRASVIALAERMVDEAPLEEPESEGRLLVLRPVDNHDRSAHGRG